LVVKTDIIAPQDVRTLPGLFAARAARSPSAVAYQQFDSGAGQWNRFTWHDMTQLVARWQRALEREDLGRGERVAIALPNGVDWVCCDQAALALGLVVVPLYSVDTPEHTAYILGDCDARLLFIENAEKWRTLVPHRSLFPTLGRVVHLGGNADDQPSNGFARALNDWLPLQAAPLVPKSHDPHALATIIYTSGTTGDPKGVMLTHHNILWNAEAVLKVVPAYPQDIFLSFLPLSHSFERTVGYYLPMMAGSRVAYARSISGLAEDLAALRPTVLPSVPRVYERVYTAVRTTMEQQWFARQLIQWTQALGWRRFEASQGRSLPPRGIARAMWPLLNKLVAGKITTRLGGRLRVAISGGAPLIETVARFFVSLGVPLIEGYGLTEASPVVATNTLHDNVPGSVGKPLPGVEVALGPEQELLVRSPGVMSGYWNQPEATQQAVDAARWLHTGDVAEISDGRVVIRGRLKELLVMSTGENVAPSAMETLITLDPLFDQAVVIGDRRPYLAALLVLNPTAWQDLAKELAHDPSAPESLDSSLVVSTVLARVAQRLRAFPSHAAVRAVALTLEPWTITNGMLTPTLKLKRAVIEQRFSAQISVLYRGHELPS
jgi:long-chain acyl-CoA synthetase